MPTLEYSVKVFTKFIILMLYMLQLLNFNFVFVFLMSYVIFCCLLKSYTAVVLFGRPVFELFFNCYLPQIYDFTVSRFS